MIMVNEKGVLIDTSDEMSVFTKLTITASFVLAILIGMYF